MTLGLMALAVLFVAVPVEQPVELAPMGHFFVSPTGSPQGDGSRIDPWDLATALSHPESVMPGSVVWVQEGTYRGMFHSTLQGLPDRPIIVRAEPGARATIDTGTETKGAGLKVTGSDTIYWGLEITSSSPDRVASEAGSHSTINRADGVGAFGTRNKYVNLVVHDTRQGFGFWSHSIDSEIYGSLIYHNGWSAPDRGHGHGVYAQNRFGAKAITDNIHYGGYAMGLRIYGTEKAYAKGFRIRGNVSVESGALYQGVNDTWANYFVSVGTGAEDIVYEDNHSYYRPSDASGGPSLGYVYSEPQKDVTVKGNYWIGGGRSLEMQQWREINVVENTFYSTNKLFSILYLNGDVPGPQHMWDRNRYWGAGKFRFNGKKLDFDGWKQATGFDEGSSIHPGRPTEPWVFVRPNRFEESRANIIIYNWTRQKEVAVDLSDVLEPGAPYIVRDALNYYGPIVQGGVYEGHDTAIPMQGLQTAVPVGREEGLPHTAPAFGVFVVQADQSVSDD